MPWTPRLALYLPASSTFRSEYIYNCVQFRFQDNTSLSFEFAAGFAMEAYFSRWKDGNERVLSLLAADSLGTCILI